MFKIGLKAWSINSEKYFDNAVKAYNHGFYDYVELYPLKDTLNTLQRWKSLKAPYIIHCPHSMSGFNLAMAGMKQSNREIYEQIKIFADELNAKYIIFHGGMNGDINETAAQLASFNEKRALIENKPVLPYPNDFGYDKCRGFNIDELKIVINAAKCGMCLDFEHALCAANSQHRQAYDYIEEMFKQLKPSMFHLTDTLHPDAEHDEHLHLGKGRLDIKRLALLLPKDAIITLETEKAADDSLDEFIGDTLFLRIIEKSLKKSL